MRLHADRGSRIESPEVRILGLLLLGLRERILLLDCSGTTSLSCLGRKEELVHGDLLIIPEFLLEFIILFCELVQLLGHCELVVVVGGVHPCESQVLVSGPLHLGHVLGVPSVAKLVSDHSITVLRHLVGAHLAAVFVEELQHFGGSNLLGRLLVASDYPALRDLVLDFFFELLVHDRVSDRGLVVDAFRNHFGDLLGYDFFEGGLEFSELLFGHHGRVGDHQVLGRIASFLLRAVEILGQAKWVIIEQRLDQIQLYEKVVQRVEGAEILHADDFASDVLGELEVHRHLAALRKGTVLAQQHHVVNLFRGVVRNLVMDLFAFKLHFGKIKKINIVDDNYTYDWPLCGHEFLDFASLGLVDN